MGGALAFGALASSSLVVGALVGAFFDPPQAVTAAFLSFACGALVTALSFELFEPAVSEGGVVVAGVALVAGAFVFTVVDYLVDEVWGGNSGLGLLAGVVLDGVPENAALGVTLVGSASPLTLLAAIFASNFPESLGGAQDIASDGSKAYAVGVWVVAAVVLTASVWAGNTLFAGVSDTVLAEVRAFAGGAVVASVATEAMPEAFGEGGVYVGFTTALGFLLTFLLK